MSKLVNRVKRIGIGMEYAKIAGQLKQFERLPMYLWTTPQIIAVVNLLEKEAELDVRFSELLIAEGDEETMKVHKYLEDHNANVLWDLKQRLYYTERYMSRVMA